MLHKVSDLSGPLLDAAVAKAEGIQHDTSALPRAVFVHQGSDSRLYAPSTDWRDAGAIIDRWEDVEFYRSGDVTYCRLGHEGVHSVANMQSGETKLIAAMRAHVSAYFGETVELLQE
jgi:hypothetical protein